MKQIKDRITQRKISLDDEAWCEGMLGWRKVAEVFEPIVDQSIPPSHRSTTEPKILDIRSPGLLLGSTDKRFPIPPRGHYEPEATLKQKNLLMKFGVGDPESIRRLGRDQASFMIDAFLRAHRPRTFARLLVFATVVALCAGIFILVRPHFNSRPPIADHKSEISSATIPKTEASQPTAPLIEARVWTDKNNRTLMASLKSVQKNGAGLYEGTFTRPNGENFSLEVGLLSDADVALIKDVMSKRGLLGTTPADHD